MVIESIKPMSTEQLFEYFGFVIDKESMESNDNRNFTLKKDAITNNTRLNVEVKIIRLNEAYIYTIVGSFSVNKNYFSKLNP